MRPARAALAVCGALLAAAAAAPSEPDLLAYLGGAGTDDCDGIALDRAGGLYLACHSDSPDFPGLPARPAASSRNSMDAVVLKLDSRTGRLLWAVRTGGSDWDAAGDLAVAPDGAVFVLGSTRSPDFPTTPDAVQRRFAGPDRDAFLLQLDPRGRIVYSTLLGGSANDEASSLALAPDGAVFVAGVTFSADFPGIAARLGPGGKQDGFIARLHPGDPASLRAVRIGGSGVDRISAIALDASGALFASGYTSSPDFPVKNPLQRAFGGSIDAFLLRIRPSDWSPLFSTWLGGAKMDGAYGLALDPSGNPVLSGVTESDDFPSTRGVFQPRRRGPVDAFVAKVAADGSRLLWSTYFGGSKTNSDRFEGGSLAVDRSGRVWFTGMTASPDLPLRDAFQPAYGGGDFDGFLAALSPDGARLCYATYLGGAAHDILEGLAVSDRMVYASGLTASTGLRQYKGGIQSGFGGGPFDALVAGLAVPSSCR